MKTAYLNILTLAIVASPFTAVAAPPATSYDRPINVQDVGNLHDQAAILQQQLTIANLQAQIRKAEEDPDASSAPSSGAMAPAQTGTPAAGIPTLPEVVSIESAPGNGRTLTATLLLPTGTTIPAYPGLGLPGGLTVYDITVNGVRVMDAGQLEALPIVTGMPPSQNVMPGMPMAGTP